MESLIILIPSLVTAIIGLVAGYAAARILDKSRIQSARLDADNIDKQMDMGAFLEHFKVAKKTE